MKVFFAFICIMLLAGCGPRRLLLHPENKVFTRTAPPAFNVLLQTTKGSVWLEVRREWAPHGVDRFYNLILHGFYDHAAIFRIHPGLWAQFGIPADPRVAQAWRSQNIPDDSFRISNTRGTVAFAFKDHNGRTTQVFINLRDNSSTHDKEPFVPFARVTRGMDIVDSLYNGYGEKSGGGIRAGKQDSLFAEGNAYLKRNWPKLDYIISATVVE